MIRVAAVSLLFILDPGVTAGQDLHLVREVGSAFAGADYSFFRIADLAVDDDGQLLVLDVGNKEIAIYDSTGTFVRRVGREGAGPGEFLTPTNMMVTDGEIVVFDPRQGRTTRFDGNGEVLETHSHPRPGGLDLGRAYQMRDGSLIGISTFRASFGNPAHHDPYTRVVRIVDAEVDTLLTVEPGEVIWHASDGLPWGVAPSTLGATGAMAVLGDSTLALVSAQESEVRIVRFGEGGPDFLDPIPIPIHASPVESSALDRIERDLRSGARRIPRQIELVAPSAVSDLTGNAFFDDRGSLWIESQPGGGGSPRRWMVLTEDSLHWVTVPPTLELMAAGERLAYGVWRDELDVQTVRIYELLWR